MEYEKPTIVDYGNITELTAAQATGHQTDASFPAHTPVSHLTFS